LLAAGRDKSWRHPNLFIAIPKPERRSAAFGLAHELRRTIYLELGDAGRSLRGQMRRADQLGAAWTAIVEDDGFTLKHMESGDERALATSDEVRRVVAESE
jgi:hypothetical protein